MCLLLSRLIFRSRRDRFLLVFFNPSEKPGLRLGEKSVQRLLARMAKRDIETRLGSKPTGFEADRVMTEGGDFQADLILFMPGLTGPEWLDNTRLDRKSTRLNSSHVAISYA